MCGVLFHRYATGPASRADYDVALETMAARGPDFRALDHGAGFVAGHVRLAIIDLDRQANQPFWSDDKRHVLTFNGEIYNFAAIRSVLAARGVQMHTASDTEVLLKAILHFGLEETLSKTRGMFAFVLHDSLSGETIAARDHFGQKPLYYARAGGGMIFASDPLAVAELAGTPAPDTEANAVYLATSGDTGTRGLHMPDRSFFKGVHMLAAGHYLRIDGQGAVQSRRYFAPWELFEAERYQANLARSEGDLMEELSCLVTQSVRRHLVSDVPAGVLLSGGIDSSAVFWSAIDQNPDIQTFTKISPGIENIPLDVVPELLRQRPASAHFIRQDKRGFIAGLERFIAYSKAPSRWNSGPSMNSLCQSARDNGVIVLLGGDCVDEYFGGYIHYQSYFDDPDIPLDDLGPLIALAPGNGRPRPASAGQYLAAQHGIRAEILERLSPLATNREKRVHATLLHDTTTFLQSCTLPHSDAYSMMASVELRNPMLDLDLVAFAVNLPASRRAATHANGEYGKQLFRQMSQKNIGPFVNIRKEGTRNYAMAMAEPDYWDVKSFQSVQDMDVPDIKSRRHLIRLINLEIFLNQTFPAGQTRPLAALMTAKGRAAFEVNEPQHGTACGPHDVHAKPMSAAARN